MLPTKPRRLSLSLLPALLLLAMMVAACSKIPHGIIGKHKMAELIADIAVGEAVIESEANNYRTDSVKQALRQSIYASYGVTSQQVDTSMAWYGRNIPIYREVLEKSTDILERRLTQSRASGARSTLGDNIVSVDGDSVDMWVGARQWRLTSNMPSHIIPFRFNRDRNWEPGDIYELRYKAFGASNPIRTAFAIEYTGGDVDYAASERRNDGWTTLKLVVDSARNASQVYGAIAYEPTSADDVAYIDSIQLVRMRMKQSRLRTSPDQHTYRR